MLYPRIMDEFWKDFAPEQTATFVPSVNIREDEKTFALELSAPGYDKSEISISVEEDVLTVSGSHSENKEEQRDNYLTREFRKGSFKRSFHLTKQIDADRIAAKYENGILHVELPKVDTAVRKAKEIQVV
ncbi:MAG: Hsp20/alpha crystallin family protein [Flavobacteriales bacterium]|nr:Hsp20/alpha crystallin family protein [Flavobacteriales bacterium]